jgi:hypothetical protein
MANRPIVPIPQDKIGENFVWRDWFQRLSNTVYGSMSSQNSGDVTITGGTISNLNVTGVAITNSSINNTSIGNATPSTGQFTSVTIIDTPLSVSSGGTGVKTTTANYVFAGPTAGAAAAPAFRALVVADIPALPYTTSTAPVTYTANFTVGATDVWVINNKPSATCTVTLPVASTNSGRILRFQNYQTQTLVSASSNVIPLVGGAASTAILDAVAGATCTLVSNGTNWVMTQYVSNNSLLLE